MKRLVDFFGRGGVLFGTVAAAGLAGLLVLMSCGDEEAGEQRGKISRVVSVECGARDESRGASHVDLYFLTEDRHGVISCSGFNMILWHPHYTEASTRPEPQAVTMVVNARDPEDGSSLPSPFVLEGFRAQNRHGDGTCGRRIYAFTQHLQDLDEQNDVIIRSPGTYYVEEHPDVIDKDVEDKDEWIGFWVGTPDEVDAQTNEGLLCPTYMKMDPDNENTPGGDLDPLSVRIPCTEEVRRKMNGRDSCLLVNDFGFPEHRTLRFDWDAALAPPESQ